MKKYLFYLLLLGTFLSGCHWNNIADETTKPLRLVTQVTVTYEDGPIQAKRSYTDSEKMRKVLNYLRLIETSGPAQEDPLSTPGSMIQIVLQHSDGFEKVYRQKANRFLMEDSGPWMQLDPEKAQELCKILGEMESDNMLN